MKRGAGCITVRSSAKDAKPIVSSKSFFCSNGSATFTDTREVKTMPVPSRKTDSFGFNSGGLASALLEDLGDDDGVIADNSGGLNMSSPPPPKLPKGRRVMDTTVGVDVDSLFKSVFGNNDFFEILSGKVYDELKSFEVTQWAADRSTSGLAERTVRYEIAKYIAFSRQVVQVEQRQVRAPYSRRGVLHAVDTVTRNSGVVYSDYFVIHIHYRLTAEGRDRARVEVVADIEFVKPCLFRGRIESETWGGLKKYYEVMEKEIQTERDIGGRIRKQQQNVADPPAAAAAAGDRDAIADEDKLLEVTASKSKAKRAAKDVSRRRNEGDALAASSVPPPVIDVGSTSSAFKWDDRTTLINGESPSQHQPNSSSSAPTLLAFLLVIVTLLLLTLAMFKMSSALARMEERLGRLEAAMAAMGPPTEERTPEL